MERSTELFVGIDVAKARNAVAVADGERNGEVRFMGVGLRLPRIDGSCSLCVDGGRLTRIGDGPCARSPP